MHIGGGLSRLRTGVRAVHLAEILATTETSAAGETEEARQVGQQLGEVRS